MARCATRADVAAGGGRRTGVLALHVISDGLIGVSYYSIPFTLAYFMRKRKGLEFNWIIACFSIFIIACGTTHLMAIVTIWRLYYWLSGAIKAVTAAASVPTAVLLVRLMPQALGWPSPASLRQTNEKLRRINARVLEQIRERVLAQAQAQAREANVELQGQLEQMRRLHEMCTRLARTQTVPDVLEEILNTAIGLQMAPQRRSACLHCPRSWCLAAAAACGSSSTDIGQGKISGRGSPPRSEPVLTLAPL